MKLRTSATKESLLWRCDVCQENVDDDDGYLYVLRSEQREIVAGQGVWRVTHTACDPHLDEESDWIDVREIRDSSDLFDWAISVAAQAEIRNRKSRPRPRDGAERERPQATCQPESAAILAAFTSIAASLHSHTTSSAISAG
jgi:hypothetical protein